MLDVITGLPVEDLIVLAILVAAFGGLSVVGVLVLMSGLISARDTSAVVTHAVLAAILFAAQLSSIAFWRSHGVGFGGDDETTATIIQWGGISAVFLVGGFLALKLPQPLGRAVETAQWFQDGARIAAVIVVAYVVFRFGEVFVQWAYSPGTPPTSLAVWLITLAGCALAWGLWRHRWWAWYAALACSVYAIVRMAWFTWPMLDDLTVLLMSPHMSLRLALLAALLGLLLFSNARKLCSRS